MDTGLFYRELLKSEFLRRTFVYMCKINRVVKPMKNLFLLLQKKKIAEIHIYMFVVY